MNLHLFSSPGERDDIRYIIEGGRPYLTGRPEAMVVDLPMASLYGKKWLELTQSYFKGLAQEEMLDTEMMELSEMDAILRQHTGLYPWRQYFPAQPSFACQPFNALSIQKDTSGAAGGRF